MNREVRQRLLCIVGPTASGKTQLSIDLAKRLDGEIINADSMQIYRQLNIGSAKPSEEEMEGIPHHLMDIRNVGEEFSVAEFQELAQQKIAQITGRAHLPIVCGGTGLFINSLTYELDFSEVHGDMEYRQELTDYAQRHGNQALHDMLSAVDPASATRLHVNDTKRIIRALEVFKLTGKPLSQQSGSFSTSKEQDRYDLCILGLSWPREVLYERINQRVDQMLQAGLMQEVQALYQSGIPRSHPSMMGIGYRQLLCYFAGERQLEDAIEDVKRESRRFAKRQLTWFKRDLRIHWLHPMDYQSEAELTDAALMQITRQWNQ